MHLDCGCATVWGLICAWLVAGCHSSDTTSPQRSPMFLMQVFKCLLKRMNYDIRICMEQEAKLAGQMVGLLNKELDGQLMEMLRESKK